MQPFTIKTLLAVISAFSIYLLCFYGFKNIEGWPGIIVRSIVFSTAFTLAIYFMKITPDIRQLLEISIGKLRRK
jgi:hypothetical protein